MSNLERASSVLAKLCGVDAPVVPRRFDCERCGSSIGKAVSLCDRCVSAHVADIRKARLAPTLETIPSAFRDAANERAVLEKRVRERAAIDEASQLTRFGCPLIVLRGAAGTGKTSLAAYLLAEEVRKALDPARTDPKTVQRVASSLFATAADLANARKAHRLGSGQPPLVAAATRAHLLVLDELGSETSVDDVCAVIHDRHGDARRTIVTTWLSFDEMRARYGDGIARRLNDSRAKRINLGGVS